MLQLLVIALLAQKLQLAELEQQQVMILELDQLVWLLYLQQEVELGQLLALPF